MKQKSFSHLNLNHDLAKNLDTLQYYEMTPIQAKSLPIILDKQDIIAQAKTGSGKTAAFGLGLLHNLDIRQYRIQSLVLCPTRELADQVAKEIRKFARGIHNIKVLTLCGGTPIGPQIGSLVHGAHIIVGTPGRIEDHLRKKNLKLNHVKTLVLDEADHMLDMGFQPTIDEIIGYLPKRRQCLLFSATFPEKIKSMTSRIMQAPTFIKIADDANNKNIEQLFYKLYKNTPYTDTLKTLLLKHRPDSTIVFCNTKKETVEIVQALKEAKFNIAALNGDLEQTVREQVLVRFANRSLSILVATDVAARGLDIEQMDMVINYQLPRELEVYTHRIGRTGRAGEKGTACTLIRDGDSYKFEQLQEYLDQYFDFEDLAKDAAVNEPVYKAPMGTIQIDGGKKQKLRPTDILGALTSNNDIAGNDIGKIDIFDHCAYVAVKRKLVTEAVRQINQGKLKGRSFRARKITMP